jgi:hypothetical protein
MYMIPGQERYEQFLKESPVRLEAECALLRLLIEQCVKDGRYQLANNLLGTLAKLSATHQQAAVRAGVLLEKEEALQLMREMCNAVIAALDRQSLPERQRSLIIDEVVADLGRAVDTATQPKLIAFERPTR